MATYPKVDWRTFEDCLDALTIAFEEKRRQLFFVSLISETSVDKKCYFSKDDLRIMLPCK